MEKELKGMINNNKESEEKFKALQDVNERKGNELVSIQEVVGNKEAKLEEMLKNQILNLLPNELAPITPTLSFISLVQIHNKYMSRIFLGIDSIFICCVRMVEKYKATFRNKREIILQKIGKDSRCI